MTVINFKINTEQLSICHIFVQVPRIMFLMFEVLSHGLTVACKTEFHLSLVKTKHWKLLGLCIKKCSVFSHLPSKVFLNVICRKTSEIIYCLPSPLHIPKLETSADLILCLSKITAAVPGGESVNIISLLLQIHQQTHFVLMHNRDCAAAKWNFPCC